MVFTATKLLYTKISHYCGYRWIFLDKFISSSDKRLIDSDIHNFARRDDINNQLCVRKLNAGVAVYKYFNSGRIDQSTRPIYALSGLFLSFENRDNVFAILSLLAAKYLFDGFEVIFDENNRDDRFVLSEGIIDCREDKYIEARQAIDKYLLDNDIGDGFFITSENGITITPIVNPVEDEKAKTANKRFRRFKRKNKK